MARSRGLGDVYKRQADPAPWVATDDERQAFVAGGYTTPMGVGDPTAVVPEPEGAGQFSLGWPEQ
jgi:hypothetical protein